jgi:hypothetical protein
VRGIGLVEGGDPDAEHVLVESRAPNSPTAWYWATCSSSVIELRIAAKYRASSV